MSPHKLDEGEKSKGELNKHGPWGQTPGALEAPQRQRLTVAQGAPRGAQWGAAISICSLASVPVGEIQGTEAGCPAALGRLTPSLSRTAGQKAGSKRLGGLLGQWIRGDRNVRTCRHWWVRDNEVLSLLGLKPSMYSMSVTAYGLLAKLSFSL